MKEMSLQR